MLFSLLLNYRLSLIINFNNAMFHFPCFGHTKAFHYSKHSITESFHHLSIDTLDTFLFTQHPPSPNEYPQQTHCFQFFQYDQTTGENIHQSFHSYPSSPRTNPCFRYSMYFHYTQQMTKVIHLHIINPRSILLPPYQCLTPIHHDKHK